MLNNRELANLILLAILVLAVGGLGKDSLGPPVRRLGRQLVVPAILVPLAVLVAYVSGAATIGARLGLWDRTMLYGTVVWFVTVALVSYLNINEAQSDGRFVRNVVFRTVEVTAILEFAASVFVLHLAAELAMQAFLGMVVVLTAVASRNQEHEDVARLGNGILAVAGFSVLGYSLYQFIEHRAEVEPGALALQAFLPVWMTLAFAPLLYAFSIYVGYDSAVRRLWYRGEDVPLWARLRAVIALALTFRGRRSSLGRLDLYTARQMVIADGLKGAMDAARSQLTAEDERAREAQEAEERLAANAGLDGTDEEGRQLDQREFEETRRALRWLSTCHMGHYNNRGSYREDLLELVTKGGPFSDLPTDHGVQMTVDEDGQGWWSWRETITGWVFGIGADGPPPSQHLYEGPEPPIVGPAANGARSWHPELDPEQPPNW